MKLYRPPTDGFQNGSLNQLITSDNPQDQRKDNLRIDYRLNNNHQVTGRYTYYNWVAIDAFRGTVPVRAHRLGASELDDELQPDEHVRH